MANSKITDLTADTSPSSSDLLETVKDPGGTPLSRKATLLNVLKGAALGVLTSDGDLFTRTSGALARLTRATLAADSAFTGAYAALPPALTSYTTTWSTTGTAPSLGNGTKVAGYLVSGKMCFVRICLIAGSTTTFGTGGFTFTLPGGVVAKTLANIGQVLPVVAYDSSAGNVVPGACLLGSAVTTLFPSAGGTGAAVTASAPFTWATGDYCTITGWFEID